MKSLARLARRALDRLDPPPPDYPAAGREFARGWSAELPPGEAPPPTPLEEWFDGRTEGHGVWKWRHYFDAYHRHLARFRGRSPVVLEVGVYSGGSLEMWPAYFGPGTRVVGVDIEPACKAYERPGVEVVVGDQGDPAFWRDALARIPAPDIVVDDGSHQPRHQRVTLEALLPALAPGGVYACEDVHGRGNAFAAFALGACDELNAMDGFSEGEGERRSVVRASPFQACVHSVHLYPFLVVIEKRPAPLPELVAPKHGTRWQPFLA